MEKKFVPLTELEKLTKIVYGADESWCQTHIGVTEASFTWVINNFSFTTDKSGESLESSVLYIYSISFDWFKILFCVYK